MSAAMARRWHAGPGGQPRACDRLGAGPGLCCWFLCGAPRRNRTGDPILTMESRASGIVGGRCDPTGNPQLSRPPRQARPTSPPCLAQRVAGELLGNGAPSLTPLIEECSAARGMLSRPADGRRQASHDTCWWSVRSSGPGCLRRSSGSPTSAEVDTAGPGGPAPLERLPLCRYADLRYTSSRASSTQGGGPK
jgi:hypothetical protein